MSESLATRMVAKNMERDREGLAREAKDLSDALARIAADPDRAVALGEVSRVAQDMQQLLIRASRLDATRETSKLYTAEAEEPTP